MDIGCYNINVARMLFGAEPVRIESVIRRDTGMGIDIVFPAVDQHTVRAKLFAQAVLDDTPVPVPSSDAVANMRVIEGILATSPML
jgi:predicted dehydrogenase